MKRDSEMPAAGEVAITRTTTLLASLVPGKGSLVLRDALAVDEAVWFLKAIEEGLVRFDECPADCPRRKKRGASGPDHFVTPSGGARHLFSGPGKPQPDLNREYIPHLAAWSRAVLHFGYDSAQSRFSHYRVYGRDLLSKRAGGAYETDVECYDADGRLILQIEAKKDAAQVDALARRIAAHGRLAALPGNAAKEIEYVLDLGPQYLWVVGPGSIDPARHVFRVEVVGNDALFTSVQDVPESSKYIDVQTATKDSR